MTFVVFDPQDGPEFFDTAEEAKARAEEILEDYKERSSDGWDEEVEDLHWGEYVVREEATQTVCEPAPEGSQFDEIWDYELRPEVL